MKKAKKAHAFNAKALNSLFYALSKTKCSRS